MNTIVRTPDGLLHIRKTVAITIAQLAKQAGYISFDHIRQTINAQLPEHEWVTRHMVRQAVVKIIENSHKHGIDRRPKA
jgi:hypothetical protein